MFIRIKENPDLDPRLWYAERQGDMFFVFTFNGLQYLISDPDMDKLMAVRMEDAEELEDDEAEAELS